jgi:hypothetical protein
MSINKKIIEVEAAVPPPPAPTPAPSNPTGKSNFNVLLYTGNGTSQTITVGFRPDMIWLKGIDTTENHSLYDSNRGIGIPIYPNLSNSETSAANHVSTSSTSFSLLTANNNASGKKYVAWCWKGNNGPSTNNNGSISAQVQVNNNVDCSIITFTGNGSNTASVGHGMAGTPDVVVIRDREQAGGWNTIHTNIPSNMSIGWQSTAAASSSMGNNGSITRNQLTSTTFGFQSGAVGVGSVNTNGRKYIAYAFRSRSGKSHFGAYTGTGSTGQSITGLGFEPNLLILRRWNGSGDWVMIDSQRDTSDVRTAALFLNQSSVQNETIDFGVEFDSNGFTLIGTDGDINANGAGYIYYAFKIQ